MRHHRGMLVSPRDSMLYLLEPKDVEAGLPDFIKVYQAPAERVVRWAHDYLCQPHPALGREGPVCPYTEPSLKRGLFWLTVYPGPDPKLEEVSAVVARYREWFLELEPAAGKETEYKAILILFPDLAPARAPGVIDALQAALKPQFVAAGLMIGQFHAGCQEPALWNRDFRPLRSSVPLLAIRHMVRTDAAFLIKDAGSLASYLRRFGGDVPGKLLPVVRDAALRFGLEDPEA
ncbi:MAG TPA: hypothetical protein VF789_29560 [Thermoanaerobaculia bacterium]